jgi:hypothetical protein
MTISLNFSLTIGMLLLPLILLLSSPALLIVNSFQPAPRKKYRPSTVVEGATGGWGIGQSREILPEEFARGDRKAFEGYKLTDRGEFMRQVRDAKENLKNEEIDELLGVAKMAGITVKEQKLNKFEPDLLADEDDDIDLSV